MLRAEHLECRDTPSSVYATVSPGRPTVVGFDHATLGEFGNEGSFVPFPDYAGPLNTALHARDRIAVGAGESGAPRVQVVAVAGAATGVLADFFAYEDSFRGGVRVALGDVTGDRVPDLITGAAAGGGPRVSVFDGATFARVRDFFAYDDSFRGGVWVGFADPDGDGTGVLVTAPGLGGGPHVKTYDLVAGIETNAFYGDPGRRDFAHYVVGDLDGDALTELAVADTGGGVRVYDLASGTPVYAATVPPGAHLGVGSYFDYFGSTLLSELPPGQPGFAEYDLALGLKSYESPGFTPGPSRPGVFAFGTQIHPARDAERVGREVLDDINDGSLGIDSLPLTTAPLAAANDRHRPLAGGISVGGPAGTGTLTVPVRDAAGVYRALSNEHVYASPIPGGPFYAAGRPVTQPGRADNGGEVIGTTGANGGLRFDGSPNPIDAALADLAPGVGVSANTVIYSDFFGGPARTIQLAGVRDAAVGDVLRHLGRTTTHARHYLIAEDATLPVNYRDRVATLAGQSIAHGQFGGAAANPGDSGSPVVMYDKFAGRWYLTGQLFAGGGVAMVYTPIQRVFDGLGVSL